MFRIVGNEIYHSRGSTGGFRFKPKLCGKPLTEPFTAVFDLKKRISDMVAGLKSRILAMSACYM